MNQPLLACADIGSVANRRFAWALREAEGNPGSGSSIAELALRVTEGLKSGHGVALGFECPLFVPLPNDPEALTSARRGDGTRPWSAGSGSAVLTTGLTQVAWILREVRKAAPPTSQAILRWPVAGLERGQLFLWEAFVSGSAKGPTDLADARVAVDAFCQAMPRPDLRNAVTVDEVYSLVGAAMLRTGWSRDLGLLSCPAIVIRASAGTSGLDST